LKLDDLASPVVSTPGEASDFEAGDSVDADEFEPEMLTKVSSTKRDEVDSYVLGLKRQRTSVRGAPFSYNSPQVSAKVSGF
jgi:hypothetical protein